MDFFVYQVDSIKYLPVKKNYYITNICINKNNIVNTTTLYYKIIY